MIILTIVGGIAGIITVIWLFLLRPKETKILEEKIKGMVALVSPLQDSVFEFVPKDELEFGKIIKKADSLFHQEKFKEAEEEYKKAYNIVKDSQKGKLIGLSLLGIGAAKGSQGNYKEAIEIFKSSLKYEKEIKDNEAIARIYFNLGYCYQLINKLKEAIKSY
ncbi:MAG: tetratricopeptide repeat protein, partial [candidate division WOR-3 bacterium]|nr:tetratricopeptide repeat protein [candidate division WOR-3 bacterium]